MRPLSRIILFLLAAAAVGLLAFALRHPARRPPAHASGLYVYSVDTCPPSEQGERRDVLVQIDQSGQISVNEELIPASSLTSRIQSIMATRHRHYAYLVGDPQLPYGIVVSTISAMQVEGTKVALVMPLQEKRSDSEQFTHWLTPPQVPCVFHSALLVPPAAAP